MLLLGSKAPGRNVEQHDFYFGIARELHELVPDIKTFWPEAGNSIHLDGWREVHTVNGYRVTVVSKQEAAATGPKLFFINLGGYRGGILEEQHYTVLTVNEDRADAVQAAKQTIFYRQQSIKGMKGANAHIDEKYGIDVDDIYRIEDILPAEQKNQYHIHLLPQSNLPEDTIHLGYLTLDKLSKVRSSLM
ncbi:DUF1543 domain-containing protein [Pedobacter sp. HMF7647]|uniref:DUF1543 domain-containing protein n=2 Tax=Hufsiella arboris TaxID=2695275 RepID=A0A7K1YFH3_9SPHI|nr:DUF1543 domain-containing protein [Hufsiella arboris]